jgi:hypothetical protein
MFSFWGKKRVEGGREMGSGLLEEDFFFLVCPNIGPTSPCKMEY